MSKIFTGLLFLVFNFNLDIGDVRIGLIPAFAGYILIVSGCRELIFNSRHFGEAEKAAGILVIVSGAAYLLDLLGLTYRLGVISDLVRLAGIAGEIWVIYNIVEGVADIERTRGMPMNSQILRDLWSAFAILNVIAYFTGLFRIEFIAVIALLADLVIMLVFLYFFYKAKNTFNAPII